MIGMPVGVNNTGLRQRRPAAGNVGNNNTNDNAINNNANNGGRAQVPPPARGTLPLLPPPPPLNQPAGGDQQQQPWRTSHVYCFVSALVALLAIITSAATPTASLASRSFASATSGNNNSNKFSGEAIKEVDSTNAAETSTTTTKGDSETMTASPLPSSYMMDALDTDWWRHAMELLFANPSGHIPTWMLDTTELSNSKKEQLLQEQQLQNQNQQEQEQQQQQPWWKMSWLAHSQKLIEVSSSKQHQTQQQQQQSQTQTTATHVTPTSFWQRWLDPSLLQANSSTLTGLIDKVSTSTPRLLAIANLLLALTYQMHTAVADWFLGVGVYPPPGEWAMTGRERLGSFLVFKLLLISAVAEPDTLDLLILLSWYTLLSFLRSLAHLAAATTSHTTQSGQPPRTGVLQLLLVVLLCDLVAALVCAALFQLAGVGKVVLLTCDCALLAVEVLGHILKHGRQVLEDIHEHTIAEMEERQLRIHTRQRRLEEQQRRRQQQQQRPSGDNNSAGDAEGTEAGGDAASEGVNGMAVNTSTEIVTISTATDNINNNNDRTNGRSNTVSQPAIEDGWDELDDLSLDGNDDDDDDDDDGIRTLHRDNQRLLMEDSRRLDQSMDALEVAHAKRLAVLDTTIFVLQLLVHAITVGHFLHIWYLHGIQFTLIDGVLALHLHSALSAASKQIAGRRNLHRIARNLDGMFPNASELDLKKAHASGDVCCICLGAMSVGSVKKVGCGHLYHTNCLREVIERALSIEAAKCPLCRASIVDGSRPGNNSNAIGGTDQANGRPAGENEGNANNAGNNVGNNATDGPRLVRPNDGVNLRGERALFRFSTEGILPNWMPLPAFSFEVVRRPTPRPDQAGPAANNNNAATQGGRLQQRNAPNNAPHNQNGNNQQSFLRRLLLLAGAVPMSPEEEARALAQLVDMFPQYDRADLLRELRDRGSAESVVESVLLGVFSGRVRGSAGGEAMAATANNPGTAAEENVAENNGVENEAAEDLAIGGADRSVDAAAAPPTAPVLAARI